MNLIAANAMSIQVPYTLNCNDSMIALYITIYMTHNTAVHYTEVSRQNINTSEWEKQFFGLQLLKPIYDKIMSKIAMELSESNTKCTKT